MVFNKTTRLTFALEAIDICHHSLPSNYEPPNDPNKTARLCKRIYLYKKIN